MGQLTNSELTPADHLLLDSFKAKVLNYCSNQVYYMYLDYYKVDDNISLIYDSKVVGYYHYDIYFVDSYVGYAELRNSSRIVIEEEAIVLGHIKAQKQEDIEQISKEQELEAKVKALSKELNDLKTKSIYALVEAYIREVEDRSELDHSSLIITSTSDLKLKVKGAHKLTTDLGSLWNDNVIEDCSITRLEQTIEALQLLNQLA